MRVQLLLHSNKRPPPLKAFFLARFVALSVFGAGAIPMVMVAGTTAAQEPLPAAVRFVTPTEVEKSEQNLKNTLSPSVEKIMNQFSPEQRAKIQQIADQVAEKMRKKHGDNPDKIQSELRHYMQNPEAFYQELSADQKNKVKEISSEILNKKE
jgi:esterase/lipase